MPNLASPDSTLSLLKMFEEALGSGSDPLAGGFDPNSQDTTAKRPGFYSDADPNTGYAGIGGPSAPRPQDQPNPYEGMVASTTAKRDKLRGDYLDTFDEKASRVPQDKSIAWRTEDLVKIGIPAAIIAMIDKSGKGIGEFLQGALGGKMAKTARDNEIQQQQFQLDEKAAGSRQARVEAALKFAESDANLALNLSENARQERLATDRQRAIDGRALRSQFFSSNLPGEAATAARLLREQYPEYAPTPEEERRQIESMALPEAKQFNERMFKFRESTYFETDKEMEAAMADYARQRGALIASGVPERMLDAIPDTKTLKQYRAENAKAQQDRMRALAEEKFKFDKGFKLEGLEVRKGQFTQRLKLDWQKRADALNTAWARLEVSRANYQLSADRNDLAKMRLYLGEERDREREVAAKMKERVNELQRIANNRVDELMKAKWKPEKIDSDPIIKELHDRIQNYLDEASVNDIDFTPDVSPRVMGATPGAAWQYTQNTNAGGIPDEAGLSRIENLKKQFQMAFPTATKVEQWAPPGGRNIAGTNVPSLHNQGLALDLYDPNLPAVADWAIRQPGVRSVIYNKRIWHPETGWKAYDKDPHLTHVHVDYGRDSRTSQTPNTTPQPQPQPQPAPATKGGSGYPSTGTKAGPVVMDPLKIMGQKLKRFQELRELAIKKIAQGFDEVEIRKIFKKETGQDPDF